MSSRLLAVDPGNIESAYVIVDAETCEPLAFDKVPNHGLLQMIWGFPSPVYIEMIASYGMPVGQEVFDTCVWIGRFAEAHAQATGYLPELIKRKSVVLHHCQSARAKDANVTQALVDRFTPGQPNHGKGTKATPGWFHGFRTDVWQAYALAVYIADTRMPTPIETLATVGDRL
jgi:hypothetical protein